MRTNSATKKNKSPEKIEPDWQVRCLKCDFTERWVKNSVRLKTTGLTYIFGRCPQCKRIRMRVVEKAAK